VRLCVFTEIYNTTLQEREKSDRERKGFIDKARGSFAINKRLQLCEYITLSDLDSAESMNSASTASSYYSRYSCCSSPHAIHTLRTQTLFMYKYVISVIEGQVHHTLNGSTQAASRPRCTAWLSERPPGLVCSPNQPWRACLTDSG
jgi:hypothetical protein